MRVILASSSPRRQELLSLLIPAFDIAVPDIDETPREGELPIHYVERLAAEKSKVCAAMDAVCLGADTTVVLNNQILGKPSDAQEARYMLRSLSDSVHEVHTAVAMTHAGQVQTRVSSTSVTFAHLSVAAIDSYLLSEEPWDKAGGYGIQGYAGAFVSGITGSYSAVVGLPLCETRELLLTAGIQAQHG